MEDNEDEPDDVKKATPVEEEITRGEIDEQSGRTAAPVGPARRRHHCEKDSAKKPKKTPKNEGDCCRERLAKAAGLPKTATVLVYEKECTLPRTKPIPRHCLTKEEWIDLLATPNRKCPSPCEKREVTRKIRPVSTRLAELARPPKNRLLNTLRDRAGTLPTELVDHLIQTLEDEACLTPEQAERMFRDKEIRARKKCQKRKSRPNCKAEKSGKRDRTGVPANASPFDREAVNCQYLMAESFVRSILDWKCPIPREEFQDIAEVIMRRLGRVLEYEPVNGEDRKSQQMRFLADIVASWISGVLFDVAEARKTELEEECERRRRAKEEESEEDSDDESDEEPERRDDDDDDDDEDKDGGKRKKKKDERPKKKKKDDKKKKGRKDGKDDDDDDEDGDKLGKAREKDEGEEEDKDAEKPGTEEAEEKFEGGETEPAGGVVEEKDGGSEAEYQDATSQPGSSPGEAEISAKGTEDSVEGAKSGEDSKDQRSPDEEAEKAETGISKETPESSPDFAEGEGQIGQPDEEAEKGESGIPKETPESGPDVAKIQERIGQPDEDAAAKIPDESPEETKAEAAIIDLPKSQEPEAPTAIDEPTIPSDPQIEVAKKLVDDDQPTIPTAEVEELAAGDKKDEKESPPEPPETPEIPEKKEEEIAAETPAIGAGDQEKEIPEDAKLSVPFEIPVGDKVLRVIEEPGKIVEMQREATGKQVPPRRKRSRIPSSVARVGAKKQRIDAPFVTFDRIFHTIYSAIETSRENPGIDAITNRLHRAVYEKCSSVVQDERPDPLPELTKDVLDVMSGKIALWLRDVLDESQLTFMRKFPATVESANVREWSKWMGDVSDTANSWSAWIQRTIRQAETMRSGRVTRGDWTDWTKSVEEDAMLWRRFYVQSQHQAHQNLTMIRDRRVVKTGDRNLDDYDDGYEREMKITDLEAER